MRTAKTNLRLSLAAVLLLALAALAALSTATARAQSYEELPPDLEERAQRIYSGVMCPQCAGQTIDESNAPVAEAMREAIRAQLRDGAADDAIVDSLVQSYGEGILASPPTRGFSLLAWLIPPLALLLGAAAVAVAIRNMRSRPVAGTSSVAVVEGVTGPLGEDALPFDLVDRELGADSRTTEER